MQVGFRDLTVWSFLMASAHGAGLMVLPVLLGSSTVEAADQMAGHHHASAATSPLAGLLATGVHTIGYLAVTGLIAWVVYRKFGLAILRKAWFNLDLVWAARAPGHWPCHARDVKHQQRRGPPSGRTFPAG